MGLEKEEQKSISCFSPSLRGSYKIFIRSILFLLGRFPAECSELSFHFDCLKFKMVRQQPFVLSCFVLILPQVCSDSIPSTLTRLFTSRSSHKFTFPTSSGLVEWFPFSILYEIIQFRALHFPCFLGRPKIQRTWRIRKRDFVYHQFVLT